MQDLLADSRDAIANCNRRSKEGKKGKGRVRVADADVAPTEIAIAEDEEQDRAADVSVAQSSVAAIDVRAERSASVLSLESTSTVVQSQGDGCDTDDTVSEADSRSVATDDSWSGRHNKQYIYPFIVAVLVRTGVKDARQYIYVCHDHLTNQVFAQCLISDTMWTS